MSAAETRTVAGCGRKTWLDEEQDFDNPCVCGLDSGHDGLHQCYEGCGGEWAGGILPDPAPTSEATS